MRKRTIRLLLKWSFPVNVILLALALLDYAFLDSTAMLPILLAYGALVLVVLVLLILEERPRHIRVTWHSEPDPHTIIYGKENP